MNEKHDDKNNLPDNYKFLANSKVLTEIIADYMNGICGDLEQNPELTAADVSTAILNNKLIEQSGIIDHSVRPDGGYANEIEHVTAMLGTEISFEETDDSRDYLVVCIERSDYPFESFNSLPQILERKIRFPVKPITAEMMNDALEFAKLSRNEDRGHLFDSFFRTILNCQDRLQDILSPEQFEEVRGIVKEIVKRDEEALRKLRGIDR